jgi:drug/metabolite transporter (DMT)-like permease
VERPAAQKLSLNAHIIHMTQENADRSLAPHLALLAVQVLFGTWPVLGKIALRYMHSTTLVTVRVVGAALAFALLQRLARTNQRINRRDFAWFALFAALGIVGNQLLFVKGLSLTTVVDATLLGTTIPIFTLVIAILFGLDKPTARSVIGIALAGLGVIYMILPQRHASGATAIGNLLIVANAVCYGTYIAISKTMVRRYGALTVITWVFIIGTLFMIPIGGYQLATEPRLQLSLPLALTLAYIILLPTVGAYYLNAWALGRVSPGTVAVYIYLQPLIAFCLAPVVLGEQIGSRTWVASALILAGVAVVSFQPRSYALDEVSEHPDAMSH